MSSGGTIGHLKDELGLPVAVAWDCDAVWVKAGRDVVILTAAQREHFQKLFTEAERHAEAWAAEHAETRDGE